MAPVLAVPLYLSIGVVLGILSVVLLPYPLVHPSRFHGISILISPLATGLIMFGVGATVRRSGKEAIRMESLIYGFVFAFGVVLVRFRLVHT